MEQQGEQLLAGKFKNVDELVKGYQELEKRVGSTPAPTKIDLASLQKEFADNGKLSDASYAALAGVGITKEFVDTVASNQKAAESVSSMQEQLLLQTVGGPEKYKDMIGWAAKNLSPDEQESFNKATSGDYEAAKLAISKLNERFTQSVGEKPASRVGDSGGEAARGADKSQLKTIHDLARMQADPRYGKDPSYTKEVEEAAKADLTYM